jgi:hypothetical protein
LNISSSDVILLGHATFGVAGCVAALWVLVETLNARAANIGRIRTGAFATAVCMAAAWICGGYWYLHFYPAEKALILHGPWPIHQGKTGFQFGRAQTCFVGGGAGCNHRVWRWKARAR